MFRMLVTIIHLTTSVFVTSLLFAQNESQSELIRKLTKEIDSGKIAFKLTEADEFNDLLGNPDNENTFQDGGMLVQILTYLDIEVILAKYKRDKEAPFTLFALKIKEQPVEIGRNSKIILRGNHDLSKLDIFKWGNYSLIN